ncbi:MAG TPA: hypothetical protein VM841_14555 [Actinomycetota bacterium]|nr:hypothetical protein [Actinomycetota bacterium]
MRMRFAAAGLAVVAAFGGGSAFAQHTPAYQPSQHCDGTTPGGNNVPVKTKIDLAKPALCFNLHGGFKGAVWVDFATSSVVIDGDSTNHTTIRCADGYAGVRLAGSNGPTILFSQGDNYDPGASPRDGGTNGHAPGSPHDPFDPTTEHNEIHNCFIG